ncbi:MAG: hypothetical protein AAF564_10645 [Bacteroidota bacterium]
MPHPFVQTILIALGIARLITISPCQAQTLNYGALHSGLADATVAFPAQVAGPNPALYTTEDVQVFSVYTTRPYNIKALTHSGLSATLTPGRMIISSSLSSMQVYAYRQLSTETSMTFPVRAGTSRRFMPGFRLTSRHVAIDGHGSTSTFALSAGFIVPVHHNIYLGASARHIVQSNLQLHLPRTLGVGFAAKPHAGFWLMSTVYHEPGYQPALHTALQVMVQKAIQLRYGITTNPLRWTGGFGIRLATIEFDAAIERHVLLGWTPELSINLVRMRRKDL